MKIANTWALVGSAVILAACSSAPQLNSATSNNQPAPMPSPAPMPVQTTAMAEPTSKATEVPAYLDPKSAISMQRSIFFDYNHFAVKPEFAKLLEMHGQYLASNPQVSIRVQGNADERGGAEYNLALGQKRADAVVRTLKLYGVKDSQLESISFGSEKPKAMGHSEAAWAQNRRVDLDYPSK